MDFPFLYLPLVGSLGSDSGLVAVDGCHAATFRGGSRPGGWHRGCGGCGDSLVRCGFPFRDLSRPKFRLEKPMEILGMYVDITATGWLISSNQWFPYCLNDYLDLLGVSPQ